MTKILHCILAQDLGFNAEIEKTRIERIEQA